MSKPYFDWKGPSPDTRIIASQDFRRRQPDADDSEAFGAPPPEIGRIFSIHSSLRRTTLRRSLLARFLIGFSISGALIGILVTGLFLFTKDPFDSHVFLFVALNVMVGPVFGVASVYLTQFRHHCGYVGEKGIAYFTCAGSTDRIRRREVLVFDRADCLRIRNVGNGAFHSFRWTDRTGQIVYAFEWRPDVGERRLKPPRDRYDFALAAEDAWTRHLLENAAPHIENGGQCRFAIGVRDNIYVAKESIVIAIYGSEKELPRGRIAEVRSQDGYLALREIGASEGLMTADGVHPVRLSELSNAELLLRLLERFHGTQLFER
jgi:hypothetical protein